MKRSLPAIVTLISLMIATIIPLQAQVQDVDLDVTQDDSEEDEAPAHRVARLSFVDGEVSFLRAGVKEWADAVENLPLLAGDQLYVGDRSRAEVQLGRGNYLRLFENTALTISDLSDTAAQFEVTEGIAIVRVERLGTAFERFEVDTPNAAFLLKEDGLYRINVRGDDRTEVIARRGSAEVTTLDGSFTLREGRRLVIDSAQGGRIELAIDNTSDDWDRWSYDRDLRLDSVTVASSPDYVNSYETTYNSFYGASDLSHYGTWTNVSNYGHCWVPRVSSGWAPYRHGQWLWIPRAGWTWLSHEPWGWAPYHYGRWAFVSGLGWVWAPGFRSPYYNYGHSYYRWRPALVYFYNCPTPRGNYVAWHPLRPGERWRRGDWNRRDGDHAHLQYPTVRNGWQRPGGRPGVTVLPIEGFTRPTRGGARPEAPSGDLSQWINRSARPGLPQITPDNSSSAPARGRADGGRSRPVVAPPSDVAGRPVITRNRPSTPQLGETVPRLRKLVSPRVSRGDMSVPLPVDTQGGSQGSQQNGGNSLRRSRPGTPVMTDLDVPVPANRRADSGRSADRNDDSGARRPAERSRSNGEPSDAGNNGENNRPVFRHEPGAGDSSTDKFPSRKRSDDDESSGDRPRGRRDKERHEDSSNDDSQGNRGHKERRREEPVIELPRPSRNSEDSGRSRERDNPPPKVAEPRPERTPEQREQRREERQEQREERRQQRKNNG